MEEKQQQFPDIDQLVGILKEDIRRIREEAFSEPGKGEPPKESPVFDRLKSPALFQQMRDQIKETRKEVRQQRAQNLRTRTEEMMQPLKERKQQLEKSDKQLRQEITAPAEEKFVVAGRVLDANTGEALPRVHVQGMEGDPEQDDPVEEMHTDRHGFYRIEYTEEDFHGALDQEPETYVRILDENEKVVYTSDQCFGHQAGTVEVIDMAIEGNKLPKSVALGKQFREDTKAEVDQLQGRIKQLEHRFKLRTDPLSMLPSEGPEQRNRTD